MNTKSSAAPLKLWATLITGIVLIAALLLPLPLDLTKWRTELEQLILDEFEIPVELSGDIKLHLGLYPSIKLFKASIPGPAENPNANPITAQQLQVNISLPHLLLAHIHITELSGKNIQLYHELKTDSNNWQDILAALEPDTPRGTKKPTAFSVRKVVFEDVQYSLNDELRGIDFSSSMTHLSGNLPWNESSQISAEGIWEGQHYQLHFHADGLKGILRGSIPWPLSLDLDINQEVASLDIDTVFNPREGELLNIEFELAGYDLSRLAPLLTLELPPLGPYKLAGKLSWSKTGINISELLLNINQSSIAGSIDYQYTQQRPKLFIDLNSPLLRIHDINKTNNWSWLQGGQKLNKNSEAKSENQHLLDPDFFDDFDAEISLKAERIETLGDWSGNGLLKLSISNKQLNIAPLIVHSGKSSMELNYHLYPTDQGYHTVLGLEASQIDLQFLSSLLKPKAEYEGLIDLAVHLNGQGNSLSETLDNANGHFRFALWPEKLDADAMDFWAVNLMGFIVDGIDQTSKVNCVLVDFSIDDGLMKHNKLLLDTSHLRAEGKGEIDLKNEKINLKIYPKAKRTKWFSLETPVEIRGNIDDFKVKIEPKNVAGTIIRNIANLTYVALPLLQYRNIDKHGRDVCQQLWQETAEP